MEAKKENIRLKSIRGRVYNVSLEHAVRLLRLQKKTGSKGWVIAEEGFEFNGNEIIKTGNSKNNKEPKTKG